MMPSVLPSYEEVLTRLDRYHNLERAGMLPDSLSGGSERMARLMRRLGSPEAAIPAVHIAGTKGKGSVAHYTAAALTAAGFSTGLYTSPHVDDVRERIMLDGEPVPEERFIPAAEAVMREADAMHAAGAGPSWFEVLTAIAFVVFRGAGVEAMVLETGLGGRLDATNLPSIPVKATGITAISKDHEDILGHTLTAIAGEKAAIVRDRIPVVCAQQTAEAMRVVEERVRKLAAPLFLVGRDIKATVGQDAPFDQPEAGQRVEFAMWRSVYPGIPLAMAGRHQADNAALALGLVDLFLEFMDREPLGAHDLRRAWRGLSLPARMEVVASDPWHVVDGAHNPASAWAAAETLVRMFRTTDRTLIFAVAKDKDYRAMLRILAPLFKRIIVTGFHTSRAAAAEDLEQFVKQEFPKIAVSTASDAEAALALAESRTPTGGCILTTGSLWLAGEMRAVCSCVV